MLVPVIVNDVPVECINHAAIVYHVPAKVILSIIKAEGGRNGMANRNTNGTYDYGVMQINSSWLPQIKPYGFTRHDLQYNSCKNVEVGTWILSQSIASGTNLWSGVGNYHSHTPHFNQSYREKIRAYYQQISKALEDG